MSKSQLVDGNFLLFLYRLELQISSMDTDNVEFVFFVCWAFLLNTNIFYGIIMDMSLSVISFLYGLHAWNVKIIRNDYGQTEIVQQ